MTHVTDRMEVEMPERFDLLVHKDFAEDGRCMDASQVLAYIGSLSEQYRVEMEKEIERSHRYMEEIVLLRKQTETPHSPGVVMERQLRDAFFAGRESMIPDFEGQDVSGSKRWKDALAAVLAKSNGGRL